MDLILNLPLCYKESVAMRITKDYLKGIPEPEPSLYAIMNLLLCTSPRITQGMGGDQSPILPHMLAFERSSNLPHYEVQQDENKSFIYLLSVE